MTLVLFLRSYSVIDSDCLSVVGFFESFIQKFEIFCLTSFIWLGVCNLPSIFYTFFGFLMYFSNLCFGYLGKYQDNGRGEVCWFP